MNKRLIIRAKFGSMLNYVPYSLIPGIGRAYGDSQKEIYSFEALDIQNRKQYIFNRVYNIVDYAINAIPFYRDFYKENRFSIDKLRTFDDIQRIPIITKAILMQTSLEQRSIKTNLSFVANTGGSTGIPLSFYKTRKHQIKEMAYYHQAWSNVDYRKSDVRLQFVGRSESQKIVYDISRNRLSANIYIPFEQLIQEITELSKVIKISYLQGYPSVLYEFAVFLDKNPSLYSSCGLSGNIKGIFLNSEYPYPEYRKKIECVFDAQTIASYGHTEGCALAFDCGAQQYDVMQSYGYVETIKHDDGNHLISTSYDNLSSPFIRYDTADIADEINSKDGLLYSFRMTDGGRSGQYVCDKNGKRISLTGLIFGRHHSLFNYCRQIQLSQITPGVAKVYYVADENSLGIKTPNELFDTNDIEMDFVFERIDKPIRTKSGKVLLLVPPQGSEIQYGNNI